MKKLNNKHISKVLTGVLAFIMICTSLPADADVHAENSAAENIASAATVEAEQIEGGPGWMGNSFLTDGDASSGGGVYSSNEETSAEKIKTITLTFSESQAAAVEKIVMYPWVTNGKTQGFPKNFSVSAWNGQRWVEMGTYAGYQDGKNPVTVNINDTCNAIKITATVLGASNDANNRFALQLRELEVWGSYTGATLMAPNAVFASYSNNIAPKAAQVIADRIAESWGQYIQPENLIDGNTEGYAGPNNYGLFYSSYYPTTSDTQKTIEFVFDKDYGMEGVVLYPRRMTQWLPNGFPKEYKIEVLDASGKVWQEVATGTTVPDQMGFVENPVTVSFDSTVGRRIRITATKLGNADSASQYALQFAEIAVLGSANIAPHATVQAEVPTADWAQQSWLGKDWLKNEIYTSGDGYYVSDTTDNQHTEKTIEFDFTNDYNMNGIVLYPRLNTTDNNGFPQEYIVEVYTGSFWKEVARGKANGDVWTPVMVPFDSTCGDKLRINVTKLGCFDSPKNYGIQLSEVYIFGNVADAACYNLDEGAYQVGSNATVGYYTSGTTVNVPGDYKASVQVDGQDLAQKVILWETGNTHPDETINACDLVALKKAVSGRTLTTKSGMKACDMNQDDLVDETDMTAFRNQVLGIMVAPTVTGKVYYVDSNATGNQNGLSPENALTSMEQVNRLSLQAGDTVLFKKGCEWNNTQLVISASGTADKPITFGNYGDGEALPAIHANGNYTAAVQGTDVSNVKVEGLEVTNYSDYSKDLRGIFFEAKNQKVTGIGIYGCYVHDVQGRAETITDGKDPHYNGGIVVLSGISGSTNQNITNQDVFLQNITIEANRIRNCSLLGIIAGSVDEEVSKRAINIMVRKNQVYGSQGDGIILHIVDQSVIEYNIVGFNGLCEHCDCSNKAYCGVWCFGSSKVCIQYNEVYGQYLVPTDSQAFDIDLFCEDITIQYNYSHDNAGGFLLVLDSETATTHTVRYNVSKNDRGSLVSASMNHNNNSGFPKVYMYNNTFYSTKLDYMFLFPAFGGTNGEYFEIKNNIFYLTNMTGLYTGGTGGTETDTAFTKLVFDKNCWYGVEAFQSTLSAKDTNGVWKNPEFVNYGAGADVFKLKTFSPCKGKGIFG